MSVGNGWDQYQQLVLQSLERLEKAQELQSAQITDIKVDVGQLKVKASMWGAATGAITGLLARFVPGLGGH